MAHTCDAATRSTDYTIASVARALDLLLAFERQPHEFGPSDLARQLGITKNLAFRLVKTLESRGFVVRMGERYRIGMRAFQVGQLAVRELELIRAARPSMQELHDRTGETIHLAVLDGYEAVCIDRLESRHMVRLSADIGKRFPLHAGACPKVLLAHLPREEREVSLRRGLPAFTRKTQVDPAALEAELDEIRRRGYGVSDEDIDLGAVAVAAPIRDWSGAVVAAISIAGPVSRMARSLQREYRDLVIGAAEEISARVGYAGMRRAASGASG